MSPAKKLTPAVHLVDEGAYIVTPHWGDHLEVAGIKLPQGESVVQDLASVVRVITTTGEVLYRKDADGKSILEMDYEAERRRLLEGATYGDDGWEFTSLDAEFEFRKFEARWTTAVRAEPKVTREPVEFEITEIRVRSGDPDIVSLWNAPSVVHDRRLYSLNRDQVQIKHCRELCATHGVSLEVPTHSALRFAQIEGKYAFDDSFGESKRPFIGTLEQCKAEKQSLINRVTERVMPHVAAKKGAPIKNAGHYAIQLQELLGSLAGISSAKHAATINAVRKRLRDLVAELSETA